MSNRAFSEAICHFNPLSPHGERRGAVVGRDHSAVISIHSPRMGRDFQARQTALALLISIHSPRMGRDNGGAITVSDIKISIHSPRMGRDHREAGRCGAGRHFNPLSPHGERQQTHTTFRREKLAHLHNIVSFRQQRGSSC